MHYHASLFLQTVDLCKMLHPPIRGPPDFIDLDDCEPPASRRIQKPLYGSSTRMQPSGNLYHSPGLHERLYRLQKCRMRVGAPDRICAEDDVTTRSVLTTGDHWPTAVTGSS